MNKKNLIAIALVVIIASVVYVVFFKEKTVASPKLAVNGPKLVETAIVEPGQVERVFELSGVLDAGVESPVAFEVPGRILDMHYQEGDEINAGAVLARVDATEYSLQLTGARSGVEKAQVVYRQAKDDFDRMSRLFESDAVSRVDYENAQNRLKMAEEDLAEATETLNLLEEDKSVLRSPINGTVLAKMADKGEVTGAGTPVYIVGQIDNLKTILPVPDFEIEKWKEGQEISLELYGQKRSGKVVRIFPATNRGTGTVGVEVSIPNPEHNWFPGQVVMAFRTETRNGIYVPAGAVINRGEEKPYVFLLVDSKASKRAVTTGELFGDKLEITSGLEGGEVLVVKGTDKLFEGDDIEVPGGNGR